MNIDQSVLEILNVLRALTVMGFVGVIAWYVFKVIQSPKTHGFPFLFFIASFGIGGFLFKLFVGDASPDSFNLASCDTTSYPNIIVCNGWPLYLDTAKPAMNAIMALGGHFGGVAIQSGVMAAATLLALYIALAKSITRGSGRLIIEAFALGALTWLLLANVGWLLKVMTGVVTYSAGLMNESMVLSSLSDKLSAYNAAIGVADRVTDYASIGELQTTKSVSNIAKYLLSFGCLGVFHIMTVLNMIVVCVLVIITNYLPSIALLMIIMGSYSGGSLVRFIAYAAVFKIILFVEFALLRLLPDPGNNPLQMIMELGASLIFTAIVAWIILLVKAIVVLKFIYFIYKREFIPIRGGLRILMGEKA